MELQELVDRIQRWKQRTETESSYGMAEESLEESFDEVENNALAVEEEETQAPEVQADPDSDVLDFDEMEVTELNNDDSGIVDITES